MNKIELEEKYTKLDNQIKTIRKEMHDIECLLYELNSEERKENIGKYYIYNDYYIKIIGIESYEFYDCIEFMLTEYGTFVFKTATIEFNFIYSFDCKEITELEFFKAFDEIVTPHINILK